MNMKYISVCRPSTNNARIKRVIALIKADSLRRTHDKTLRLCERTFRNGKKGEICKVGAARLYRALLHTRPARNERTIGSERRNKRFSFN